MTTDSEKLLLKVAGPNGSGKSSLVYMTELSVELDKIINPDNFARALSNEIKDPAERYGSLTSRVVGHRAIRRGTKLRVRLPSEVSVSGRSSIPFRAGPLSSSAII